MKHVKQRAEQLLLLGHALVSAMWLGVKPNRTRSCKLRKSLFRTGPTRSNVGVSAQCTHTHSCLTWHSETGPWQPAPCPSVAETSFVRPNSSRCLLPLSLEPLHWAFRGLSTCLTNSVWNLSASQLRKRERNSVSSKGHGCCTVIPEGRAPRLADLRFLANLKSSRLKRA